jgi:hypothetical protein
VSKRLLELARVRTVTVTVADEVLTVHEPSGLQMIERRSRMYVTEEVDGKEVRKLLPDATERGLAYLLSVCVRDASGQPSWNESEAMVVATGRAEVALPVINAVTEFLAHEKKASTPPSDSGTA